MRYTFMADEIPVLRFCGKPDRSGQTIHPSVKIKFPETIPVTYGPTDMEHLAGHARLRRVGDVLVADMTLFSVMNDIARSEDMIQKLYPATSFYVHEGDMENPRSIEVVELFLTPHGNCDDAIVQLGLRLRRKRDARDLH